MRIIDGLFKITKIYVNYPKRSLAACWSVLALLSIIVLSLNWFSLDDFTSYDWTVPNGKGSSRQDAYDDAVRSSDTSAELQAQERPFRTFGVFRTSISLIYRQRNAENIFNPKSVQAICEFERIFTTRDEYRSFCLTANASGVDTECDFANTPLFSTSFYPNEEDYSHCELLSQENIDAVKVSLLENSALFFFERSVGENYESLTEVDYENLVARKTRSSVVLAGPLGPDTTDGETYSNVLDLDSDPQYKYYLEFLEFAKDEIENYVDFSGSFFRSGYFENYFIGKDKNVQVKWYTLAYDSIELDLATTADSTLVAASILFVLICNRIQVQSWFLAIQGLIAGLSGISADNLYVFDGQFSHSVHSWRLSKSEYEGEKNSFSSSNSKTIRKVISSPGIYFETGNPELEILGWRLVYTMSVAGKAVFNTTSTTVGAFLATSSSPVAPISSFGIYAAMVVFSNFLYIFTLFPAMFLIYTLKYKPDEIESTRMNLLSIDEVDGKVKETDVLSKEEEHPNILTRFFADYFIPAFEKSTVQWKGREIKVLALALVSIFMIWTGIFIRYASLLSSPSSIEGNFQNGHMYTGIQEEFAMDFAGGSEEQLATVFWTFGIKGIDRSGFNFFDPNGYRGEVVYDKNFDLAPSESQLTYLDVCNRLETLSCVVDGELLTGCTDQTSRLVTIPEEIDCLLDDFYAYTEATEGYNMSEIFEVGDEDPVEFYRLLEEFSLSTDNTDKIGFIDGKLTFISIKFVTTLQQNRPLTEK
eukprot:snap_masked-scaffold_2-processed-gene-20.7-mRNA-1 protein AED:1.00 eAED:1.00 QI:0/0/0/0/1/1/2/0/759